MDKSILYDEYMRIKSLVDSFRQDTPYYVYCLAKPNGLPFYIGKGKSLRLFAHIKNFINGGAAMTKSLRTHFEMLGGEPPIMHILKGDLSEQEAFDLEKSYIEEYKPYIANIMPGGGEYSNKMSSIYGGKIGGNITKNMKLGIFSDTYDRGAQTKLNHKLGLYDGVDYSAIGKLSGAECYKQRKGIHSPENEHMRSDWGKMGAMALIASGNLSGICSKEWRNNNKELCRNAASAAGKIGGGVVGSMLWWTDGVINKRSYTQPSIEFKRGMTKGKT